MKKCVYKQDAQLSPAYLGLCLFKIGLNLIELD